jgi:hypothetical protein
VKGGCEAAVHATRRYIDTRHRTTSLLNSIFTISIKSPNDSELNKFCCLSYDRPTTLQFGDYTISSEVGVQQGDPLGGLLFCIGIHPILSAAKSELSIGYLDDITLGGPSAVVADDIELFRSCGSKSASC